MPCRGDILVVDDDELLRQTLADILEVKGYRVCTARDGQEAVENAQTWGYKLIIMDVRMPRKGGLEALCEIAELRPVLPVVMMTAFRLDKEMLNTVKQKSVGLLTKPFDLDTLLAIVQRSCGEKEGGNHG